MVSGVLSPNLAWNIKKRHLRLSRNNKTVPIKSMCVSAIGGLVQLALGDRPITPPLQRYHRRRSCEHSATRVRRGITSFKCEVIVRGRIFTILPCTTVNCEGTHGPAEWGDKEEASCVLFYSSRPRTSSAGSWPDVEGDLATGRHSKWYWRCGKCITND